MYSEKTFKSVYFCRNYRERKNCIKLGIFRKPLIQLALRQTFCKKKNSNRLRIVQEQIDIILYDKSIIHIWILELDTRESFNSILRRKVYKRLFSHEFY
jgi:hypothetical protein